MAANGIVYTYIKGKGAALEAADFPLLVLQLTLNSRRVILWHMCKSQRAWAKR